MKERLTKTDEIIYLWEKINNLNGMLWDNRLSRDSILEWLDNFKDEDEKDAALFLLSKFVFFNKHSIKMLLVALYRDLYRYPIISRIRRLNGSTTDENIIEPLFNQELNTTLFTIVGSISESSSMLYFDFRTENGSLNVDLFQEEVWKRDVVGNSYKQRRFLNRCIFIDDFCGTGQQILSNPNVLETINRLKGFFPHIKIYYYCLIGTTQGLSNVRARKDLFYDVDSVVKMDDSFKCFSVMPRIFNNTKFFDKKYIESMCRKYGADLMAHFVWEVKKLSMPTHKLKQMVENHSLGYQNCQLLIGMDHNVPDNTLPIIWYGEEPKLWTPIFKRTIKNS